ncbi:MAG: hypothetical protein NUV97_00735 [archaeon]|nr:hypothetical protein [archaeon]MCR4323355.1 hypothetical protein [Nanoarchaeota archaeon]
MIRAIMIVEMAGMPPQHVKEKLTEHIEILRKVNDIEVHSITVSEPAEIKDSKGIYTCFAEADFETQNFARLSETMFDFMPSSVEVIEPSSVIMDAPEATNLLNNISGRMHRYDEIAKIAQFKINQLTAELQKAGHKPEVQIKIPKKKEVKKKTAIKKKVVKKKKK